MRARLLKTSGLSFLLLLLVASGLFYTQIYHYERYPLKIDKTQFPGVNTAAEIEQLAEHMLATMTLDEEIEQLYGEPSSSILKLGVNLFLLKRFPHMYIDRNERLGIPPFVLSDGPRGGQGFG